MISQEAKRLIVAEATKSIPNEACGFIVDGKVMVCKNVHSSPTDHFAIAAEDYAKAEESGTIEAVFHSHGRDDLPKFSSHDIASCKESNLPWILYSLKTGGFTTIDPTGNAPYTERPWAYGVHDCYSLTRDFYRRELGIVLDDFHRGEEMEWQQRDWKMFAANYAKQGFRRIERPEQKGDILLMQIDAPSPNHVGVMTGNGMLFYHHLMDRLSEQSIWGGMWEKVTTLVLRHESQ